MKKIACTVILFYPTEWMIKNINKYIGMFGIVYIFDNTPFSNLKQIKKLINKVNYNYISFNVNKGLSYALSYTCLRAIKDGYNYIMTLDQDSVISLESVGQLQQYILKTDIAIVAPVIRPYYEDKILIVSSKENLKEEYKKRKFVITSGCIINLDVYKKIGGFDTKLFIEYIDVDYCIKVNKFGGDIYVLLNTILYQRAGNSIEKRFLTKLVHPLFSVPERGFYLFRNHIYLLKKYGIILYQYTKPLSFTLLKTILYENSKVGRIKYYLYGFICGLIGNMDNRIGE